MSRSGPSVGGISDWEILVMQDPKLTDQLLHVCGEHIGLLLDVAMKKYYPNRSILGRYNLIQLKHLEQEWNSMALWFSPVQRALQRFLADCQCSPFGRLVMKNAVVSGSAAEDLARPPTAPHYECSDVDIMIELGPIKWAFPGIEETSTEVDTAATVPQAGITDDPRGQDSNPTPRLVIEETENPGYVLVLQERRDDCPHKQRLPFKAEYARRLLKAYQFVTHDKGEKQCDIQGPSSPLSRQTNSVSGVSEYDEVSCLHVPVWWFSNEFFTRNRRYNWPPEVMEDIRRYGLHLVPVGAPGSSTEEWQWRLSFSRAEVVIVSHMTDMQRCAVVAFKLCKAGLEEKCKVMKSYFVKTALFWLCEKTPAEDWNSVTQGVLLLLDFLDQAVSTGILPCFFWSRINLLQFTNRADRRAMKKTLSSIRKHVMKLLARGAFVVAIQDCWVPKQKSRMSEREVRVWLGRRLIIDGVVTSLLEFKTNDCDHNLKKLLPVLMRSYPSDDLNLLVSKWGSHRYQLQTKMYQALTVVPEEVTSQVHFSASGDGFVWDAAPLLRLLTEDDLKSILKYPDAVRSWLRRHHQVPENDRPAGTLPADLRSPRDLCDLLLNVPLLCWVLRESVPLAWRHLVEVAKCNHDPAGADGLLTLVNTEEDIVDILKSAVYWVRLENVFTAQGMHHQTALLMAHQVGQETRELCDDPETLAEHRRMRRFLPDHWKVNHFVLRR